MGVEHGSILQADDYLQNYKLEVMVRQYEAPKDEPIFLISNDGTNLGPLPEEKAQNNGELLISSP